MLFYLKYCLCFVNYNGSKRNTNKTIRRVCRYIEYWILSIDFILRRSFHVFSLIEEFLSFLYWISCYKKETNRDRNLVVKNKRVKKKSELQLLWLLTTNEYISRGKLVLFFSYFEVILEEFLFIPHYSVLYKSKVGRSLHAKI